MRSVLQSEIVARHKEIAEICVSLGVRRLDVFGSSTRSASPRDIDLLVDLGDRPPAEHVAVYFTLLERLQALFTWPIDLVTATGLTNPYYRQRVEQGKALIYSA